MGRLFRILAIGLGSIIALLGIALLALTLLVDPNDYKPQIQQAALDHGNLDLKLNGELGWALWPSLGVSIGSTEARVAGESELFASIQGAHVSVALLPLFTGSIALDRLTLDGLDLNLLETADGANWEQLGPQSPDPEAGGDVSTTEETTTNEETASGNIPISIPELAITNGRIRYANETDGSDIRVNGLNILASDINFEESFPLHVEVLYQDQSGLSADNVLDTLVTLNLEDEHYQLTDFKLESNISGVTSLPLTLVVSQNLEAKLKQDSVSIRDLMIKVANANLSGNIDVTQMSTKPVLAGELQLVPTDINQLLASIGEAEIETANPDALSQVALQASLSGPANSLVLNPFKLQIDSSNLTGHAGVTNLDTSAIAFDLTLDQINVDDYLPPVVEQAAEQAAQAEVPATEPVAQAETETASSNEPLLPLEDLRSLIIDGRLAINQLSASGIEASQMEFIVKAKDGLLQMEKASGNILEGHFSNSATLDARTDMPVIHASNELKAVQLQPLVKMAMEEDLFTGLMDMNASFRASGNSESALAESANGKINMTLTQGTLNGINLHSVLLAGIQDLLNSMGAIKSFIPAEKMQKVEDSSLADTHIRKMQVDARLKEQVAYVDAINAELDDGTLTGKGYVNTSNEDFDLRLALTSERFSDNKYFQGRAWPLKCAGNLSGEAADWCGHDKDGFNQIGKDIAAQAAKEKLGEKLGVSVEGDSAEEMVKNAAKEKAKQELKNKLDEKLKGLFGG